MIGRDQRRRCRGAAAWPTRRTPQQCRVHPPRQSTAQTTATAVATKGMASSLVCKKELKLSASPLGQIKCICYMHVTCMLHACHMHGMHGMHVTCRHADWRTCGLACDMHVTCGHACDTPILMTTIQSCGVITSLLEHLAEMRSVTEMCYVCTFCKLAQKQAAAPVRLHAAAPLAQPLKYTQSSGDFSGEPSPDHLDQDTCVHAYATHTGGTKHIHFNPRDQMAGGCTQMK